MSMPNKVACPRCHAAVGYACRDLVRGGYFWMAIYHRERIEAESNG
jgi:hypothetical protein